MNRSISFLAALVAVSPLACASNVGHEGEQAGEQAGTSQQALTPCTNDVLISGEPGQCRGAWRYHKLSCNEMRTCNPGESCACEHERAWARADGEYRLRPDPWKGTIVVGWGGKLYCDESVYDEDINDCEWLDDYWPVELCKPQPRCVKWGRWWRMSTPSLEEQARQAAADLQRALAAKEGIELPFQSIVEYKISAVGDRQVGDDGDRDNSYVEEYRIEFDVPYAESLPCQERDLGKCTLESVAYSPVGATRDQLGVPSDEELRSAYRIVPAGSGPAWELTPALRPQCTTYDSLPVNTMQEVRDKFDALHGMVQEINAAFPADEARRKEVLLPVLRELTTLYLVKSTDLDAGRILLVTRLVHEYQDLLLGGPAAALQEGAANCGNADAVIEQLVSGSQAATGEAQSAEEAKFRLELLLNVVRRPHPSDDTQRREELKHHLELIGQWWSHALHAPNSDDPEGAGDVMKAIYDGVYGPGLRRLGGAALSNRYKVYQELLDCNLEPDRELLALLYPSTGPLPLPPKVTARLTGSALLALSKRLKVAGRSQDFGCRFLNCKAHQELKADAPIAGIWTALGAMGNASDFQAAVDALQQYNVAQFPTISAWRTSLKHVADRYGELATVLVGPEGQNLLEQPAPPAHVRQWSHVVREGRARKAWFDKTGMLELWPDNIIRHDLNDNNLKLGNVLAAGGATANALSRMSLAVSEYHDHQKQAISSLVQELDADDRQVALMALIEAKTRELNTVAAARERLSTSLAADEARFGDFLKTWEEAVKDLNLDEWQVGPNNPAESFNTSATDAPTTLTNNIADWSVGPKVQVEKGDFLALGVSGMWAPSCALSKHYNQVIQNINNNHVGPDLVVDYGDTGPEGYHFVSTVSGNVSFGSSHAESESYSSSYSDQFGSCGGFGINYFLNVSNSGCNQTSWGTQQTTTDTSHYENSESITQSAAFETGVRVPGTPSELHAAGALLMFVMGRDIANPYQATQVQTVHRSAGVQIEQPSDIYFVVNDRYTSACPASPNSLTVQVHKARNLGALAQDVGQRLAAAVQLLRERAKEYAEKGVLLDSEIVQLRSLATSQVGSLEDGTPDFFRNLVSTVIEQEITRIVRMVEIHNLGLRLEQLKADLIEQAKLRQNAKDRKQLASLLSYLSLQGLDETELMQTRSEVEDVFTTKVHVVAKLRGPRLLACAESGVMEGGNSTGVDDCSALHGQLMSLATSDVGMSQADSAEALATAANGILVAGRVLDYEHDLQNTIVALRVPNPFLSLCGEGAVSDECTYPIRSDTESALIEATKIEAPPAMAHAIWSQLLGNTDEQKTYFELLPEHIYSALSQHGALACASASPVVHAAAWVIAGGASVQPIDDFCTTIDVWKERVSLFQTPQGTEEYRIDSEINETIPAKVPLLLAPWNAITGTYQTNLQGGCQPNMPVQLTDSPFGAYRFAVPPTARAVYGEDLRRAPEVYLMFSVSHLPILVNNPACMQADE